MTISMPIYNLSNCSEYQNKTFIAACYSFIVWFTTIKQTEQTPFVKFNTLNGSMSVSVCLYLHSPDETK